MAPIKTARVEVSALKSARTLSRDSAHGQGRDQAGGGVWTDDEQA